MVSYKTTTIIFAAVIFCLATSVVSKSATQDDPEFAALVQESEVYYHLIYFHTLI